MGLLNNHFIRAERFLKVDGDGYYTPPLAQFVKRPEFIAAALYAAVAAASTANADLKTRAAIAFLPGMAMVSLLQAADRGSIRRSFNGRSSSNKKIIDTLPDKDSSPTSPTDWLKARSHRNSSVMWCIVGGTLTYLNLKGLPLNNKDTLFSMGIDIWTTGMTAFEMQKFYVMNNVVSGKWVITDKPPTREQEFGEAKEEKTSLAPQPA